MSATENLVENMILDAVDGPASWLGFKLINQAAADDMSASVLPAANSISGRVWVALSDSDGDSLYVAGIVVGVAFTASAVRYSVAFPIAPQPKEGVTMFAVVEDIESGIVLAELPEDETVFDAVLTEDAALLMPVAILKPGLPGAVVYDGIAPELESELRGTLTERVAALAAVGDDPMAALTLSGEVLAIVARLGEQDEVADPVQADPLASARFKLANDSRFKTLTRDFTGSLSVIKGVDDGVERGWDRSLFVNSIVGKIKTQAKNDPELAGMLLAWLDAAQRDWKKPAITARNGVWAAVEDWGKYKPLFGAASPAPEPVPVPEPAPEPTPEPVQVEPAPVVPAPAVTPTKEPVNMEAHIKIAADSIGELRRIDVYRVLNAIAADNIDGVTRADLATYISDARADLMPEVAMVMAEEWPELGWAPKAAAPAVVGGEHAELLKPNEDGTPKVLVVPPVPEVADTTTAANPQRAADMAFLNGVVSQSVDMWDDGLADKIEAMGETYAGDAEVEALWGTAIASYTDFMVAAMGKA